MINALFAAIFVATVSFVGVLFFGNNGFIKGTHRFILPAAVGVFLGVIFFELIPEALHESEEYGSIAIVIGFLGFYLLSHILRTYHHHHTKDCEDCVDRSGAHLLLFGDAIHNIADGIVIASAFLVDPVVGLITTVGIALHEIPQEIAEFSILISAGYTKLQALLRNFLSASSIILGVLVTFLTLETIENALGILIGIAAGNLLYIAATDLLPELNKEHAKQGHFWHVFLSVVVGLVVIAGILEWSHDQFGHDALHNEKEILEDITHGHHEGDEHDHN